MLRHLRVTNFAILSDVAIDFAEGFNALTGETGAGKSLIVEAVNLLRGGRASADIPRAGAKEAIVEAIFDLPNDLAERTDLLLSDAGLPRSDDGLLVRRVIQRGGRSRTYVNGALTTATRLAQLGANLVDLSGQHQHQGLVDPRRHRALIDAVANEPAIVKQMAESYERLRAARARLEAESGNPGSRQDRIDYLRFQLDELDAAALESGEDETLELERTRLLAVDRLHAGCARAEQLVYSDDRAVVDQIDGAVSELERLASVDSQLTEPLRMLEEARVLADEAATALRDYSRHLEADPRRLADVEERLAQLGRLKRKHGPELSDVIERAVELASELDQLEGAGASIAELEGLVATALRDAETAAATLSRVRAAAATTIAEQVTRALGELDMAAAAIDVVIEATDLGPHGADHVEIMLRSNRGEDVKPLARVASGGELSRIMLALKLALRRADSVASYVFDEVDAGIGGATAEVVGKQIRAVASDRQVICVTHLPQIAAFANAHFHVSKYEVDGRTETKVERLTTSQRRDEIARMLSGARLTKRARAHAGEMLDNAR